MDGEKGPRAMCQAKKWIAVLTALAALLHGASLAQERLGNPPEPPEGVAPPPPAAAAGARVGRGAMWRRLWLERDEKTTEALGLRAAIRDELRNVPTLGRHIEEFFAIQRERATLERERREIALRTDRPSHEQLAQFHALLQREDQLGTRSAELLSRLRRDRAQVEKEVRARLDQLERTISNGDKEHQPPEKARELAAAKRWRRFYQTVLARLDALDATPSAGEWFASMMRDWWRHDVAGEQSLEGAARQLERLQREQEELRRRVEEIRNQIDDLTELLGAMQVGAAPPPQQRAPESGQVQKPAQRQSPRAPRDTQRRTPPLDN